MHPAEIARLLSAANGSFAEHDFDDGGRLVPVDRPLANNPAGVVVGLVSNATERYPEGMQRVAILGDPTRALGSLAEPECRRIIAALDLAERLGVPVEWFALSAGAKIAMDSGTENMDWIAAVLRRIVEVTQAGTEINVIVTGINVGAQPYWNAEATMLMHTRGILVMAPSGAMVLTGKQALDYSGAVSAEDNFGIGGYERIMGPNGQAQYRAADVAGACRILLSHYEHTYVAPGERFPRRATTADPADRDVRDAPHHAPQSAFARIGDVFSDESNPERKQPFDIRSVMRAAIDADHAPLERWTDMQGAEAAVVWDAHLGGWPVTMLGIESRPLQRHGVLPADGPEEWSSGTLFPRSSKKVARAINAASGRRPVVVLANLAGFDGSPESMREWQLEYGAEIGRAVVNFDGPIVFCVVSRYHGGAFVVFSQRLNPGLETVALEGAHASVIGGAPAAGVVFARDVAQAAAQDPRIAELDARIDAADGCRAAAAARRAGRALRGACWPRSAGPSRRKFDAAHSVERAVRVGSVRRIIAARTLRPVPDRRRRARHAPREGRGPGVRMPVISWLHRSLADVPADDGWLTPAEREVLAGLAIDKRRQRLAARALHRQGSRRSVAQRRPRPRGGARRTERRARCVPRRGSRRGLTLPQPSRWSCAGDDRSRRRAHRLRPRGGRASQRRLRVRMAGAIRAGARARCRRRATRPPRQPGLDGQGGIRQGARRGAAPQRPTRRGPGCPRRRDRPRADGARCASRGPPARAPTSASGAPSQGG